MDLSVPWGHDRPDASRELRSRTSRGHVCFSKLHFRDCRQVDRTERREMAATQNDEETGFHSGGESRVSGGCWDQALTVCISCPQNRCSAPEAVPGGRQRGVLRRPLGERPGEPGHPPSRLALCGGPHQQGLAGQGAEVHAGDGLPAHGGCFAPHGAGFRVHQLSAGAAKGHQWRAAGQ